MMKAYDSVSLESLQLALRRLDIPEKFVIWITGLFKNRQMNVITAFGLSPTFIEGDGINQRMQFHLSHGESFTIHYL
jgi:hypothetical protein